MLEDETGRAAIDAAESFLEGLLSPDDLRAAHDAHARAFMAYITEHGKRVVRTRRSLFSFCALEASNADKCDLMATSHKAIVPVSVSLLRDIFGNPFRPVTFVPAWRTSATVGLARSMYDARDFAAMPVLADALEEAGCDSADVLAHCRGPGPHVRGCWVVDLVLGY
jgi:hypothetical protein